MIVCESCGKTFSSEKGLHCHLKAHKLSVAEYYEKFYPRYDLYSKKPIKYKNTQQYLKQDFNSKSNMEKWLDKFEPEDPMAQAFLEGKLLDKLESKKSKYAPPNLYLRLANLPTKKYYDLHFGSYDLFIKSVDLKNQFYKFLPKEFWYSNLPLDEVPICIDTREQKPLYFKNSHKQKLDFGDYTAGNPFHNNVFIERKSASDFAYTLSGGIYRFRKEIERCKQFDSYMFVVIESEMDKIYSSVKSFKPNMDYIWHNIRQLILDYPNNIQFLFSYNRLGSEYIIPRLLWFGKTLKHVDVQYYLEKKIKAVKLCHGQKEHNN